MYVGGGGTEPRTIAIGWCCQTKAGRVIYLPTAGIGPRRSASGLWRREPERAGDENVQTKLAASQTSGPGGTWGSCDRPPEAKRERETDTTEQPPMERTGMGGPRRPVIYSPKTTAVVSTQTWILPLKEQSFTAKKLIQSSARSERGQRELALGAATRRRERQH